MAAMPLAHSQIPPATQAMPCNDMHSKKEHHTFDADNIKKYRIQLLLLIFQPKQHHSYFVLNGK